MKLQKVKTDESNEIELYDYCQTTKQECLTDCIPILEPSPMLSTIN